MISTVEHDVVFPTLSRVWFDPILANHSLACKAVDDSLYAEVVHAVGDAVLPAHFRFSMRSVLFVVFGGMGEREGWREEGPARGRGGSSVTVLLLRRVLYRLHF